MKENLEEPLLSPQIELSPTLSEVEAGNLKRDVSVDSSLAENEAKNTMQAQHSEEGEYFPLSGDDSSKEVGNEALPKKNVIYESFSSITKKAKLFDGVDDIFTTALQFLEKFNVPPAVDIGASTVNFMVLLLGAVGMIEEFLETRKKSDELEKSLVEKDNEVNELSALMKSIIFLKCISEEIQKKPTSQEPSSDLQEPPSESFVEESAIASLEKFLKTKLEKENVDKTSSEFLVESLGLNVPLTSGESSELMSKVELMYKVELMSKVELMYKSNLEQIKNLMKLSLDEAERKNIADQKDAIAFSKIFGVFGAVGITSSFVANLKPLILGVLEQSGKVNPSGNVAVSLQKATDWVLIVSQVSTLLYASQRITEGLTEKKYLENNKQIFENVFKKRLSDKDYKHIQEITDKKIVFSNSQKVISSPLIILGQLLMLGGSYFDNPYYFLAGAVVNFTSSVFVRGHSEGKENNFIGKESEFTKEKSINLNPHKLLEDVFNQKTNQQEPDYINQEPDYINQEIINKLTKEFTKVTDQLAEIECYSLLQEAINNGKTMDYLESKVNSKQIINISDAKIKEFYNASKEQFTKIFDLQEYYNEQIMSDVTSILEINNAIEARKIMGLEPKSYDEIYNKESVEEVIIAAKDSLKFLRNTCAQSFIQVALAINAQQSFAELNPSSLIPSQPKTQDESKREESKVGALDMPPVQTLAYLAEPTPSTTALSPAGEVLDVQVRERQL